MHSAATGMLVLLVCAGCAHLPDATLHYYLPASSAAVTVQRTVSCDPADNVVVVDTVTPTVTHAADTSKAYEIAYASLNSIFADSDVKFDFSEDGRLTGVNATLTGQGETILTSAISIAGQLAVAREKFRAPALAPCDYVRKVGGDKGVTLSYRGPVDLSRGAGSDNPLEPDTQSAIYAKELASALGPVSARVVSRTTPAPPVVNRHVEGLLLRARQPGLVEVSVAASTAGAIREIWHGTLVVAQAGVDYDLPIPRAPAFGKQVFVAQFAGSGALTSVQYVSNTGAASALNVVNTGLTTAQGLTARRAQELNAEADLIIAQQRIAQCRADPANCR
ncbi:MAG: hypothetical protein ACM3SO_23550 [Betaproteobacteria bacterium]